LGHGDDPVESYVASGGKILLLGVWEDVGRRPGRGKKVMVEVWEGKASTWKSGEGELFERVLKEFSGGRLGKGWLWGILRGKQRGKRIQRQSSGEREHGFVGFL